MITSKEAKILATGIVIIYLFIILPFSLNIDNETMFVLILGILGFGLLYGLCIFGLAEIYKNEIERFYKLLLITIGTSIFMGILLIKYFVFVTTATFFILSVLFMFLYEETAGALSNE